MTSYFIDTMELCFVTAIFILLTPLTLFFLCLLLIYFKFDKTCFESFLEL